MKRVLLCATALMVTIASAIAQEVINIHMKDGSVKSFNNGIKKCTATDFWSYEPDTTRFNVVTSHENGCSTSWDVNGIDHSDNQYTVLVYWTDMLPSAFEAEHGVCFGTKQGLSVENCDAYMFYTPNNYTRRSSNSNDTLKNFEHYMLIGAGIPSLGRMDLSAHDVPFEEQQWWYDSYTPPYELWFKRADSLCNIIKQPLEYGHTYYYRTFAKATYAEGSDPVYFYGTEHSFRVPNVMGDNGYYSYPQPDEEAIEDFKKLFPEGTNVPAWGWFEPLWKMWLATDEGSGIDLSADIVTKEFEDGTGYQLKRIPTEFYTWLIHREIVIDPIEGEFEIGKYQGSLEVCTSQAVTDVDAKWNIEGNSYVVFEPVFSTVESLVTYYSHEMVPGTKYQLQLFFAPETRYEQTEENKSDFLPTNVRVVITYYQNGKATADYANYTNYEVSGVQATTITLDNNSFSSEMDINVQITSRVSSSQFRNGVYNRILRIAGMKFTPINENAEQE